MGKSWRDCLQRFARFGNVSGGGSFSTFQPFGRHCPKLDVSLNRAMKMHRFTLEPEKQTKEMLRVIIDENPSSFNGGVMNCPFESCTPYLCSKLAHCLHRCQRFLLSDSIVPRTIIRAFFFISSVSFILARIRE